MNLGLHGLQQNKKLLGDEWKRECIGESSELRVVMKVYMDQSEHSFAFCLVWVF